MHAGDSVNRGPGSGGLGSIAEKLKKQTKITCFQRGPETSGYFNIAPTLGDYLKYTYQNLKIGMIFCSVPRSESSALCVLSKYVTTEPRGQFFVLFFEAGACYVTQADSL